MKYFIDTEFIEGFHKPLFGKKRHFIDLISIGIVCEDGRTLYYISNEYKYKDADKWVQKNVIDKMYMYHINGDSRNRWSTSNFQKLAGFPNKFIAERITDFCVHEPEFYGYYSDYDWVLFCSLFGRMIDLPKGFPMYCRDLKQMLDEKAEYAYCADRHNNSVLRPEDQTLMYSTINGYIDHLKNMPGYPKQENEHNALADAKWNKKLYEFLQTV